MTLPPTSIEATTEPAPLRLGRTPTPEEGATRSAVRKVRRARLRRQLLLLATFAIALQVAGSSAQPWQGEFRQQISQATTGWGFDLLGWEAVALRDKATHLISRPAAGLTDAEGATRVKGYLERADSIRDLERQSIALLDAKDATDADRQQTLDDARALREEQERSRPVAEAVLESQIARMLSDAGFGVSGQLWPPLLFSFTESPRKLVVSPRERITTLDSRILNPSMPIDAVEAAEEQIEDDADVSVYIADTGGMGAFPTMVVDDASLPWILSTVAHEWAHTYLSFFPLGFNYGKTPDNTTINETVADILGDEIGLLALQQYYPEMVPPRDAANLEGVAEPLAEGSFDYRREMRATRRTVDQFLYAGRVEDAERYMELRRQFFIENGYHLRKLNQAWFAFHGSYGTGPAADVSSPDAIAPKVKRLRDLTPDLFTFMRAIRSIQDAAGLDRLLAEQSPAQAPAQAPAQSP